MRGAGVVYLRGNIWWLKYYRNGTPIRESSRSASKPHAEHLLYQRTGVIPEDADPIEAALHRCAIGTVSELLVSADLIRQGYEVYRAVSQHSSCDIVALKAGKAIRVQVKTGNVDSRDCILISILKEKGRYDLLAVVVKGRGIYYKQSGTESGSQRLEVFSRSPVCD